MNNKSSIAAVTALINASVKATRTVLAIREAELYRLNYELQQFGHPYFEPTVRNARALLRYYEEQLAFDAEFAMIINENY